jgi:hypothetical protein
MTTLKIIVADVERVWIDDFLGSGGFKISWALLEDRRVKEMAFYPGVYFILSIEVASALSACIMVYTLMAMHDMVIHFVSLEDKTIHHLESENAMLRALNENLQSDIELCSRTIDDLEAKLTR